MRTRFARRLVFAVLWLALLDQFVPGLLRRIERERYEAGGVFRFENSDLFALGPLVSYLREHPQSARERVVFLGNSFIFGYGLAAGAAIPAQFQRLQPGTQVFNAAFNGAELSSSYLIAKDIVDAVDRLFVLVRPPGTANALLPALIPVEESDLRAFALPRPDPVERRLESFAGIWRLYGMRYRLQAGLFTTSTRQYVYVHKRDALRRLLAPLESPASAPSVMPASGDLVVLRSPRSIGPPDTERRRQLRQHHQLLCDFADLARSRGKRIVFLQVSNINWDLGDAEAADLNAMFAPLAEIVILDVPPALRFDYQHLTPEGAQAVAAALMQHERGRGIGLP